VSRFDSNIARMMLNPRKQRAATPNMTTEDWGYLWIPVRKKYAYRMIYRESDGRDFDLRYLPHARSALIMTP
jgi:hypothetical protein